MTSATDRFPKSSSLCTIGTALSSLRIVIDVQQDDAKQLREKEDAETDPDLV